MKNNKKEPPTKPKTGLSPTILS